MANGLVRGRNSLLVGQEVTDASTALSAAHAKRVQAEATLADAERAVASGQPDRLVSVTELSRNPAVAAAAGGDRGAARRFGFAPG